MVTVTIVLVVVLFIAANLRVSLENETDNKHTGCEDGATDNPKSGCGPRSPACSATRPCKTTTAGDYFDSIAAKLKTCAYFISAVSLLFAFVVYVKFPSQVQHYKVTILSHMASLCCGYVMLTVRGFIKQTGGGYSTIGCYLMATVSQFAFLSAFFWLNVLSIELWRIFRGLKSATRNLHHRTFSIALPSLYAWGTPLLVVGTCVALDCFHVPFRPDYTEMCWLSTMLTQLAFFYGPMGILVFVNIVLFALTVTNLRRQAKDISIIHSPINKKIYRVALKLIIVMGVSWIAEVISWAAGNEVKVWLVVDIVNGLQGFFFMVIYVLKPDVLKNLVDCCLCTGVRHRTTSTSSTSRQALALSLSQRSSNTSEEVSMDSAATARY